MKLTGRYEWILFDARGRIINDAFCHSKQANGVRSCVLGYKPDHILWMVLDVELNGIKQDRGQKCHCSVLVR